MESKRDKALLVHHKWNTNGATDMASPIFVRRCAAHENAEAIASTAEGASKRER